MTRKLQTKPETLKNHWADEHLTEASNVLELDFRADADDDEPDRVVLLQLEPALA